jgi:hypothetical protein
MIIVLAYFIPVTKIDRVELNIKTKISILTIAAIKHLATMQTKRLSNYP